MSGNGAEPGHILVVDDNEMNRDMLARRLVRQGHTVERAVDGRHALDRLAAEPFDLVLLDIMMPEMNGYEVLEHLRADPDLRHIPVILISALDDVDSVIKGIEKGADDHLPKPFNAHILQARVGACLAKKRLRDREQLYARALAREIDIGREIQAGFFPETLPDPHGWELAARFQPARSVAGDFYDAFPVHDGSRIGIAIADVCGKGVGAALFMALFRTLIRALGDRILTEDHEPDDAVRRLVSAVNDYIATTHGSANMFATIFLAVLDPATGELVYVNGGHDAPVITGPDGVTAILAPTGPAVGLLPEMEFGSARATIAPDETLVAFTDGVIDARAEDGAAFSQERLLGLLEHPADSADGTLDRIVAQVRDHTGDTEPFDDITLLAIRRHPR
jgi:phosphoserine phosphatase RsbU/P